MAAQDPVLSADERKAILDEDVALAVGHGARVEARSDFQAVLVFGEPVNHLLHLALSLLTAFIWVLAWIIEARNGGEHRVVLTVDPFGAIERVEGPG